MSRVNRQGRRSERHPFSTRAHASVGRRTCTSTTRAAAVVKCVPVPPAEDPVLAVQQLFRRCDTRVLDLLDVLLANEMLRMVGFEPLDVRATATGRATVHGDEDQVAILRAVSWDTRPEAMEAWLLALAPRLVEEVLTLTGQDWAAEAELSVDLALSLRADDVTDLADQLEQGPVGLDASRSAAEVIADDVADPVLVHFV